MAATIECPDCGAVLRPAKPVAAGKKLRCPKCEHTFAVPAEGDEDAVAERRATAVKKKSAPPPKKPAAKKAAAAPAPAPTPGLDDDDDRGAYGVIDTPESEQEESENKPKIEYAPDVSVTDPRGPATAALAAPSTLIILGALMAVSGLVAVGVFSWPFMFSKDGTSVKPAEARVIYKKEKYDKDVEAWQKDKSPVKPDRPKPPPELDPESPLPEVTVDGLKTKRDEGMSQSEREIYDELKEEDVQFRVIGTILSVVGLLYGGFMAGIAVKMTNLESYKWSMTAAILSMVTLLGLPFGMWAMTLLKKDEIKEAFAYDPEDHL